MSREEGKNVLILSPLTGRAVPLEEVPDPVFSQKIIGDGMAVIPTEGKIVSPADAQIVSVADTGHAYGLKTPVPHRKKKNHLPGKAIAE